MAKFHPKSLPMSARVASAPTWEVQNGKPGTPWSSKKKMVQTKTGNKSSFWWWNIMMNHNATAICNDLHLRFAESKALIVIFSVSNRAGLNQPWGAIVADVRTYTSYTWFQQCDFQPMMFVFGGVTWVWMMMAHPSGALKSKLPHCWTWIMREVTKWPSVGLRHANRI